MKTKYSIYIVLILVYIAFCFVPYHFVIDLISKDPQKQVQIQDILNINLFIKLKIFIGIALVFCSLIIYKFKNIDIKPIFKRIKNTISFKWNRFSFVQKIILLAIVLLSFGFRLYYAFHYNIIYDEAFTYNSYSSKFFLIPFFFYSSSNNHILHSVLTSVMQILPFDQLINLRLAAIIPSIISIILIPILFSEYIGKWISILIAFTYSFVFANMYYGFVSRGYSLLHLAFILQLWIAIQMLNKGVNKYNSIIYILISCIGFLTIPIYLYPYISISCFLFISFMSYKQKSNLKKFIYTNIIVFLMVIMAYLPIILINGLSSITAHKYIIKQSTFEIINQLVPHFDSVFNQLFLIPLFFIFVLISIQLYLTFIKKRNSTFINMLWFVLLLCPLLLIFHSIIPIERTWTWINIVILLILAYIINNLHNYIKAFVALGLLVFSINNVLKFDTQFTKYDIACDEGYADAQVIKKALNSSNPKHILIINNRIETYLKYWNISKYTYIKSDNYDFDVSKYDYIILNEVSNKQNLQLKVDTKYAKLYQIIP